jgi:NDP-sugar pyrophosphorylase family protein
MGVVGIGKSVYYSVRHTRRLGSILVQGKSSVSIHSESAIEIENTFQLGVEHTRIVPPVLGGSRLEVERNATFQTAGNPWVGPATVLNIRGEFCMGNSYINGLSRVFCLNRVEIGDGCAIAWDVDILDSNGHQMLVDGKPKDEEGSVLIGDNVWIGRGVTILPDVEIGDGAIIAADSVVVDNIPEGALAAGHPAEVVLSNVSWE